MCGRRRRIIHLSLQRVDLTRVLLQSRADFLFEVVDDDEVREEGNQIFDAQKFAPLEELHCCFDTALIALDDGFRHLEP